MSPFSFPGIFWSVLPLAAVRGEMRPNTLAKLSAGSYRKVQLLRLHTTLENNASDPGFQNRLGDQRKSPVVCEEFLHMPFCSVHAAVGRHLGADH